MRFAALSTSYRLLNTGDRAGATVVRQPVVGNGRESALLCMGQGPRSLSDYPRKGSWTASRVRPAGCLARRNEAQLWVYSNELQRRQAPRGACPGGRSGLHLAGELRAREESMSNQYPAYFSKRSTALSRIMDESTAEMGERSIFPPILVT